MVAFHTLTLARKRRLGARKAIAIWQCDRNDTFSAFMRPPTCRAFRGMETSCQLISARRVKACENTPTHAKCRRLSGKCALMCLGSVNGEDRHEEQQRKTVDLANLRWNKLSSLFIEWKFCRVLGSFAVIVNFRTLPMPDGLRHNHIISCLNHLIHWPLECQFAHCRKSPTKVQLSQTRTTTNKSYSIIHTIE